MTSLGLLERWSFSQIKRLKSVPHRIRIGARWCHGWFGDIPLCRVFMYMLMGVIILGD